MMCFNAGVSGTSLNPIYGMSIDPLYGGRVSKNWITQDSEKPSVLSNCVRFLIENIYVIIIIIIIIQIELMNNSTITAT